MLSLFVLLLGRAGSAQAQPKPKVREVAGTVVDVQNKPVANATVTITGLAPVQTAADGTFRVTNVPIANVTVDVAATGFSGRQVQVVGAPTPLQLNLVLVPAQATTPTPGTAPGQGTGTGPGQTPGPTGGPTGGPTPGPTPNPTTGSDPGQAPPVDTRLVGGVVSDGKGAPVANAIVRVRGTALQAVTAADGTFSIPNAAATELVLDIEAPDQPATSVTVAADKAIVAVVMGGQVAAPTTRTVRGRVFEPGANEPVVAAQVTVVATGAVAFTDEQGNFVLENVVNAPFQIEVSATGSETRVLEVPAAQDTIDVALALAQGEQIVIEGRAPVIVKQNLASGASVVKGEELNRVSAQNVDSAMQGKLAGANLQFNSGAPGGGAQLRLRGISTINGQSSPLYVIDGVIVSNVSVPSGANAITGAAAGGSASNQDNAVNRIADLNPNDIETIEVLKGASAAALYGSKAANGVVVITTRRGRNGENRVEVTQRVGVSQVSNKLGSRQWDSVEEVMDAYGATSPLVQAYMEANGQTFDHEAAITRTPLATETIASASGGTENGNYYGSILVRDDPGVVIGTYYEKQTGRIALGYKLGERVRLGLTANIIHSQSDRGLTNNDNTGTSYYMVLSGTPNFVNLNPRNGVFPVNPAVGSGTNPLQNVQLLQNREDVWRLIGGTTASVDAYTKGPHSVRLLGNFGVDSFDQKNNLLSPNELIFEPLTDGLAGTSIDATTTNLNWNLGTGALWNYQPKNGSFRNSLSGGLTYENVDLSSVYVVAQNLTAGQPNVDSGTSVNVAHNRLRTKDAGLYIQEELAVLDERLSLLAGLLGERSSLNGNTGKYFLYPKLASVYSLLPSNNEDDENRAFEALRVRAAYGEAGNRPNYGQKFTPLNATSNIEGNAGITILGNAGDPNIEPERQREVEVGADVATRDQKIVGELTLYQRSISNLLLQRSLATSTGFTTEFFNGGSMRNRGVELALQATAVDMPSFSWTTRGILTLNRSLITDLPDGVPAFDITAAGFGTGLGAFRIEEGKSATQIVGTIDEDGTVAVVGNGEPDFRVGWSNELKIGKDITIGTLVDWQQGSDVVNLTRLLYDFGSNSPDAEAAAARLDAFSSGDIRPYIEDATFVKLREVAVTYNLPKRIAAQLGPLRTLSMSLSGRNLATWTNYSGLDPEVSNFGNQPIGRNYDVAPYPPSRSFWFSLTAGL